jgi:D-alanyl-lipoteichoic acid acyltransferase DltB (MBOAT superfamily)
MLFHTWEFAIFFTIVMAVYLPLKKTKWWSLWLLATSYFFYGWWNPLFLILIVYSTAVDYLVGLKLGDSPYRRTWLTFSLINNIFLLGFFKYANFFAENLRVLFTILHIPIDIPEPNILLPVGISFFTFQSMSYSIDVFRGQLKIEKNYIRFSAFVALFPQLVAGPIERAKALLPQMRHNPIIRKIDVSDGISLFLVGLFKKAVMADILALYADKIYGDPEMYGSWALLFGTYAFAWQIYFDFSGYTDMARGIAKIMGIRLMLNFNNPYTAVDLGDFWKRWHISLSSWFKDYVYIPLGGNKGFKYKVYWNVFITMAISGFWHGAAWTFVIWGLINAIGRVITMPIDHQEWYKKIPKIIKQLVIFHFICLTWVFFRATSVSEAMLILRRFFSGLGGDPEIPVIIFALVGGVWIYQLLFNSRWRFILESRPVKIVSLVMAMLLFLIFATAGNKQFIYFQF